MLLGTWKEPRIQPLLLVALEADSRCHLVGVKTNPSNPGRVQEPSTLHPLVFRFCWRPSSTPGDPVSPERSRSLAGLKVEAWRVGSLATKISNPDNPRQNKNIIGHKLTNVGPFLRWSPGLAQLLGDLKEVSFSAFNCTREEDT